MAYEPDIKIAVEAIAPQYADNPRAATLCEFAEIQTAACLGDKYAFAVALRLCHYIAIEEKNGGAADNSGTGAASNITAEKEGDLSISYGAAYAMGPLPIGWNDLTATQYGLMLISLLSNSTVTIRNRFSGGC